MSRLTGHYPWWKEHGWCERRPPFASGARGDGNPVQMRETIDIYLQDKLLQLSALAFSTAPDSHHRKKLRVPFVIPLMLLFTMPGCQFRATFGANLLWIVCVCVGAHTNLSQRWHSHHRHLPFPTVLVVSLPPLSICHCWGS